MSYTPTEWEPTDVVTATRMNALETAVGDMNMSYTPNTWSDGDILSAEKMNALEQAVASGGGGGSSDFSTAQVTITNNALEAVPITIAQIMNNGVIPYLNAQPSNPYILSVVLYKGVSACIPFGGENISVSGNAQLDSGAIVITGDCTITIS